MEINHTIRGWKRDAARRRAKRRALDLTLIVVAQRIGVSESTLHRWERGTMRPSTTLEREWVAALFAEER